LTTSIHHDGQIWSRALWHFRKELGHVVANTLFLEVDYSFAPDALFEDAAMVAVKTAHRLFGKHVANEERNDFAGRRILTG